MELQKRINFLMSQYDIKNPKELSEKSGIPYTTLRSIICDNVSNIRMDTAVALANFFGVSIDFLTGYTNIANPKQLLEESLAKCNLTESEYSLIMEDFISKQVINLSILNSTDKNMTKIKNAYHEIFNVYINYLGTNPLENETDDIEVIEKHNKPIDIKFIEMLKTLDKNKIIYKEASNVFPTLDIPRQYPVLGKISAGLPILAVENIEGYSYAPSSKIQEGYDYFFLRVDGDSMNLKFPNGCLLLIQRQCILENGQIGVFRINGDDATVKRFKEENNLVILEPMSSNPEHQVQTYNPKKINVEIIGKVISYIGDIN